MYVRFLIVVNFFARSLIFSFVFSLILFIRLNNLECVYEIIVVVCDVERVLVISLSLRMVVLNILGGCKNSKMGSSFFCYFLTCFIIRCCSD